MRTRLTLRMVFGTEQRALAFIRDNGLFSIGAQVVALPAETKPYRVIVDTARPDAVCRHLAERWASHEWARSESAP